MNRSQHDMTICERRTQFLGLCFLLLSQSRGNWTELEHLDVLTGEPYSDFGKAWVDRCGFPRNNKRYRQIIDLVLNISRFQFF